MSDPVPSNTILYPAQGILTSIPASTTMGGGRVGQIVCVLKAAPVEAEKPQKGLGFPPKQLLTISYMPEVTKLPSKIMVYVIVAGSQLKVIV